MSVNSDKIGKKRGFSLIFVLILSVVAFSIVGGIFQFVVNSGGAGRIASSSDGRYNLLQDSAELGKAALKKMMDNTDPPPRFSDYDKYEGATPPSGITSADQLLINVDLYGHGKGVIARRNLSSFELGRRGIVGPGGVLEVKIYDMQYKDKYISATISDAERIKLPPAIVLKGVDPWKLIGDIKNVEEYDNSASGEGSTNTGAYLVRSVLTVGGRESILDTAVFQSNNAT
jgi:hypothetical protein